MINKQKRNNLEKLEPLTFILFPISKQKQIVTIND